MVLPKIELHLHLEGAVRHETILDLAKQKSIKLEADNLTDLKLLILNHQPKSLGDTLKSFDVFMPALIGDPDAIERIAYELCETQAENGVIYFETRYCPQFLSNTVKSEFWKNAEPYRAKGDVTPEMVVQCVNKGLRRGQADFGVKARSILCCITAYPEYSDEILRLVTAYTSEGVVGIDVAGSGIGADEKMHHTYEVFKMAKERGLHRTVHAGESGAAVNVKNAVDIMYAERIGHGYAVLDDKAIYEYIKKGGYHIECCPLSSVLTSSVLAAWIDHAVKVFSQDNVNFSISTDDPTVFGNTMESEFKLCLEEIGLTLEQLYNCQINAAKSCFLPDNEKEELIETINRKWKVKDF